MKNTNGKKMVESIHCMDFFEAIFYISYELWIN